MATTEYDIDQNDFRAWLQAHADQTFKQSSVTECALSVYLTERMGEPVRVSYSDSATPRDYFYIVEATYRPQSLPAWVAPINRAAQGHHEDPQIQVEWTGAQLLKLLDASAELNQAALRDVEKLFDPEVL